jgi:YegS/Rv2252/BmrU family lipid kinase
VETRPVPREAALIVNAHSRSGEELFHEARSKLEQAGVRLLEAHVVDDPGELAAKVRAAVQSGAPMIIVGGGDGTLSSAVDELVEPDCVFAFLPLGTANSFARSLGIPLDLDGAIRTIATGERRRIDLGIINGDYFANAAAMGLSPIIGETVPRKLKRYLGRAGYLVWAVWCLLHFRPFRLTVDDGNGRRTLWATEVRIFNGSFHGGVELLEDGELDNGLIVVQAVAGKGMMRLAWDWFARFFKLPGRHLTTEEFKGSRLVIETRPHLPISIDGEVLTRTPAVIESAHRAIEVVVPSEPRLDPPRVPANR